MMNEKWFLMSVEEIEKKLKTSAASGLSPKAARSRANLHKKDEPFFTVKKKRIDKLLLDIFSDIFLVLLTILAILSLFFDGDVVIASGILVVIIANIALTLIVYYRDVRTVESMSDFFAPTARVIRSGKLYISDYRDLVEGDVILVEKGDILGCDARLVHSDSLTVRMKIDKKNEKILEKYASGAVRDGELFSENMTNMIHAGSVVLTGSGRAIVTAVGNYTYLGAMTGGITELPSRELPEGLSHFKKQCSKLGMLLLLLTLPFCTFSVLFGSFEGGNSVLSEALLLALSIGACAMLSRASNLFCHFYARFVRRAAVAKDPCIMRSLDAFDKLADVHYLFLLDGSIATDGILHFERLVTADGDTSDLKHIGQTSGTLCELIALYSSARTSALSIGVVPNNDLEIGIREFMSVSGVDTEALKIRCQIHSYLPGIDKDAQEIVTYTDRGEKTEMSISSTSSTLKNCKYVMVAGTKKILTLGGVESLIKSFERLVAMGRRPIAFSVGNADERCFVGMLVLHEGSDPSLAKAVSAIRKSGMSIVSFSNCTDRVGTPEIPDILRRGNRLYKDDLLRKGLDVTHSFGSYDEYCGFNAEDIAKLVECAKKNGKRVAVCGFTDYASDAIACSDVFISCAPVRTGVFGHFSEEIRSLEVPGEQSSASCTQLVKAEADILLMRPQKSKGGLLPLATAIGCCRLAYRNFSNFVKYFVFAQLVRIIAIALPMMLGQTLADARHMLLLGFGLDMFAMFIFTADHRRGGVLTRNVKNELSEFDFAGTLKKNKALSISALLGAILCLILPRLADLVSVFGEYFYTAEYTFVALVTIQICLFVCVYVGDIMDNMALKKLFKIRLFIIELCSAGAFLLLSFVTPIGRLFGLVKNPIIYFLLSLLPAVAFTVCYLVMTFPKKKKAGEQTKK
jgi:magnesium-transporting ATPase (P-type)